MTYFVKIGAIKENKSGVGSRGHHLFRRGRSVTAKWGAIKVDPGRKFYWCYVPQKEIYKCASEQAAREEMEQLIQQRVEQDGYSRLPARAKII